MRIAPHSRTVTPVISLPQDSVIVPELCSLIALAIASSTGGFAAAPCPAPATGRDDDLEALKYGCACSRSRIAKQEATSAMYQTECLIASAKTGAS